MPYAHSTPSIKSFDFPFAFAAHLWQAFPSSVARKLRLLNQFSGDAPLPPETTAVLASGSKIEYGLRHNILTPWETLAQSVAAIAPVTSPVLTIPLVFALAGNGTWAAYALGTVQITLIALLIGALGRRSASPGSLYSYATDSLPPMVAAVAAWALVLGYIATGSSIVGGFVQYSNILLKSFTNHTIAPDLLVLISVLGAATMAYRDVKLSARAMLWLQGISTACIVAVLVLVLWKNGLHVDWPQLRLQGSSIAGVRLGLVLAIFSFVGFESATALGHEAKEPLRTIPRAVLQCALGAGVFFVLAAYAEVLGFRNAGLALDKTDAPMHVLANQAALPVLGLIIDAGAMISMFACLLACITAAARIFLLMAHNGLVPMRMCRTHHRNETPHVAVLITALVVGIPVLMLISLGILRHGYLRLAWVFRGLRLHHDLRAYLHCAATQAKEAGRTFDESSDRRYPGGSFDDHGPGGYPLSSPCSALFLATLSLFCLLARCPGLLLSHQAQAQPRGDRIGRFLLTLT